MYIIQKLYDTNDATREELLYLLDNIDEESKKFIIEMAYKTRLKYFGNTVYVRGLIEISSYCKKDCLYCGLRRSNKMLSMNLFIIQKALKKEESA